MENCFLSSCKIFKVVEKFWLYSLFFLEQKKIRQKFLFETLKTRSSLFFFCCGCFAGSSQTSRLPGPRYLTDVCRRFHMFSEQTEKIIRTKALCSQVELTDTDQTEREMLAGLCKYHLMEEKEQDSSYFDCLHMKPANRD